MIPRDAQTDTMSKADCGFLLNPIDLTEEQEPFDDAPGMDTDSEGDAGGSDDGAGYMTGRMD